jgi:hypothetical protein
MTEQGMTSWMDDQNKTKDVTIERAEALAESGA